jgi:hypothetical protein
MAKEIAAYGGIDGQNSIREERIVRGTSLQVQILNGSFGSMAALCSRG